MNDPILYNAPENSPEVRELHAAAFETLLFFPGVDLIRWCQVLLKEYTSEVVDALGDDAESVMETLQNLWYNGIYEDESTGISHRYCEWAAILKDKAAVDFYYSLVEEANKAKVKGKG